MPKLALPWKILIGIVLGVLFGIFFYPYIEYISWIGELFMNALKMIVIPLVFSSIFVGVAKMGNSKDIGRIAGKTISFYITTTLIAVLIGLTLVTIIKPGKNAQIPLNETITELPSQSVSLIDEVINIVPSNIFKEMANGNLLPIIFFAILLGIFATKIEDKNRNILTDLFSSFYSLIMKVTSFIILLTPYGVFAIVANMIGQQADDSQTLIGLAKSLGIYVAVVWMGCLIQGFGILPLIVRVLGKENPWRHIKKMTTPLLTAFTTCSSSAALPLSIRDSQERCGISEKIAGFTLPLGCTVNMNGTALFECVTAIFIAQVYGIELSIGQSIAIILTSLIAAIGAAGIPMAGIVMMTVVFNVAGLPLEGVGIIMAVQQICEMPRSCLNSYGDMCGAVIVAKSEGEKLTI